MDNYGEEFTNIPGSINGFSEAINSIRKNTQRMENLYGEQTREQTQKTKNDLRRIQEILFNPIEVANSGIPAKKSSLTDEEIRDFNTLNQFKLETIKGRIKPGLLLLTPTEHNRFDHYDGKLRKEN